MPSARTDLSPREREVLALAGQGLSSKEIARLLDISYRTVDEHIANAIMALGAKNRSEAVVLLERDRPVEIRTGSPALAGDVPAVSPMPPDRSKTARWWARLPILRSGRQDNDLTVFQRLAWILIGAVAIIFVFSQLANGLRVAEEIMLGLRH